jgi:aspartate/methionine/tyrosine aminotransferase
VPEPLAERLNLLFTHSFGSTAHFTQIAAIEALTGPQDYVNGMIKEYERRGDVIIDGLNRLPGVHCLKPHGAFYAFANIQETGKSSKEAANLMLDRGVTLLPDQPSVSTEKATYAYPMQFQFRTSKGLWNEWMKP